MTVRPQGALLLGLLIWAGCAPPRGSADDARWLLAYNRWNRTLEQLNVETTSDAAGASRGYRLLRDSTWAAMETLNVAPSPLRRGRITLLYTLHQRVRYNLLAAEFGRLGSCAARLEGLAGRTDSLTEFGDFASAGQWWQALDSGADSLDLAVRALLAEDTRSAWDSLRAPLPRPSSDSSGLGPRWRVNGDSIPPDPGEVRVRLRRLSESTRRRQREIAERRPAQVRSGWVHRANRLVEELNAAVGLDAAGSHQEALRRLTSVRDSAAATLAEMIVDTTRWPGRATSRRLQPLPRAPIGKPSTTPASTGAPPGLSSSFPPSDPEDAVREALRLVDLNLEAVRHNLAVGLYRDVAQRLAVGHARPRTDAARLDSILADPHLDADLRRMIVGLRKDLEAIH